MVLPFKTKFEMKNGDSEPCLGFWKLSKTFGRHCWEIEASKWKKGANAKWVNKTQWLCFFRGLMMIMPHEQSDSVQEVACYIHSTAFVFQRDDSIDFSCSPTPAKNYYACGQLFRSQISFCICNELLRLRIPVCYVNTCLQSTVWRFCWKIWFWVLFPVHQTH